jgi:hypothetical protein
MDASRALHLAAGLLSLDLVSYSVLVIRGFPTRENGVVIFRPRSASPRPASQSGRRSPWFSNAG